MLLTQNPQHINLGGHHHRRHPASLSTITALPHPVPGLLSLSKPQRLPSRHPPRPQSPRRPPRSRFHRPNTTDLSAKDHLRGRSYQRRTPVDHVTDTPPSVPFPQPQPQRENQPQQMPAQTPVRSRRTRHKSTPSATVVQQVKPVPSPERRLPSPKRSDPIPVPVSNSRRNTSPAVHKILSRSDPLSKLSIRTDLAPLPKRKERRRRNRAKAAHEGGPLPLAEWDFPAPGTSDDEAYGEDDEPVTPIAQTGSNDKAWSRALLDDGPKTAPLQSSTASTGQFPFFQFPPRSTAQAQAQSTPRKHRRAPSHPATFGRHSSVPDAMFHLSEDEHGGDAEVLRAVADMNAKMSLLFNQGSPSPSSRKPQPKRESMDGVTRQLFASSSFQIAPEPVELPKPSFLHA